MSERLRKRELRYLEKLDISNKDLVLEISHTYLSPSCNFYQETFNDLNRMFFENELPTPLIFGAELNAKVGGTFFPSNKGYIAVQEHLNMFERECTLLHEMQHYSNFIKGVDKNSTHGEEWAKSCQHILDKLNIPLKATKLTEDELKSFPQLTFDKYNITFTWSPDTKLYLNPITDDYKLIRKPDEEIEKIKEVVCTGTASTDLQELIATFGNKYKTALKDILC